MKPDITAIEIFQDVDRAVPLLMRQIYGEKHMFTIVRMKANKGIMPFDGDNFKLMKEWLSKNIACPKSWDTFLISMGVIVFVHEDDAMLCYLTFS